jgi:hypothetical protein
VKIVQGLGLVLLMALGNSATADEMYLKNGSVLVGSLVSAENDLVVFDTPFAGKISVKEENVARVVTDSTVTLKMDDGRILRDRLIDTAEGQLVASGGGEPDIRFATTDIELINPEPWQLGDGYKWSGDVSAALETERGNSDTDEWDFAGKSIWRSLTDRYTIRYLQEIDKNNNDKTTDDWFGQMKYDRFFQGHTENYWGVSARFEYDRFQDLDLRTTVGPYLGRRFVKTPNLTIIGELGPVYVDEQFDTAEDDDYPGALWDVNVTSEILGFGTTLYLEHDGILNMDSPDDLILNTRFGIKMPLILGFETKFEGLWEYDGGAVEGVDDTDETYNFRIGYVW